MEVSNPDVLNEGTSDAGVNLTPDEGAFGAQQVAYYIKYQNAHLRFAGTWPDPSQLRLAALPSGGGGATVFWNTGAALFKHGQNKETAAEYMRALTYDQRIWEHSVAGGAEDTAVGQLPVYQSIWDEYEQNRPDWLTDWADLVFGQLENSRAITTHKFGLTQFQIGKPYWEKYLKGEESDPRKAMQETMDAVAAEVAKGS
jgi:multiple sugar transport system substrate-binding protein